MNNITLTAFLVAALGLTQGLNILLRNRSNRQFRAFAVFCGTLVVTNLATALFAWGSPPLRIWAALRLLGALACTVAATRFFAQLLVSRSGLIQERPGTAPAAIALGVLVALFYSPGPQVDLAAVHLAFQRLMESGPPQPEILGTTAPFNPSTLISQVILVLVVVYVFGSLAMLIRGVQRLRRVVRSPAERTRLALLFWLGSWTVAATALQGGLLFYYADGLDFPIGGIAQLVFVYFLSQTLLQYRLLDLQEMISKVVIFASLTVVVAVCYGILIAWFSNVRASFNLMVTLLLASGVVLTLYEPLRAEVMRLTHRIFFRRRLLLRGELEALERDLPSLVSPDPLLDRVMAALQAIPRVTRAAIYLWDESAKGYRQQRRFGPDTWHPMAVVPATGAFIDGLSPPTEAYVLEDLERELDTDISEEDPAEAHRSHEVREILATLKDLDSEVVVPILGPEVVMGFLVLQGDESDEGFTHDEVVLLTELGRKASVVIRTSESLARLTERERLAALGSMSAGLAHEIRNPLGAIRGAAQFLHGLKIDDDAREFLDIIVEEVDRLNHVVRDFLDYSRPIRLERAPVHLGPVVRQTARLLEAEGLPAGVKVDLDLPAELPRVEGDEEKLRQVFLNLGRNAIQAMAGGGHLLISCHLGSRRGNRPHPTAMLVSFQDTGSGIDPQHLQKLFIPFYTTRREGNGLGLAICQRLIEAHDGSIHVESSIGIGSRFTVYLPLDAPPPDAESGVP